MSENKPAETVSETITKLSLIAKLLSILERFLPAFLVAYNNELKNRAKRAEFVAKKAQADLAGTRYRFLLQNKNRGIKDEEIIDNFLERKSRPTTKDDPSES